jgi:hypothetical protein
MNFHCPECGSKNLRPSRIVRADLARLLTLRAPARCRDCRERFFVGILEVREIEREAEKRRLREAHDLRPSPALELQRQKLKEIH